MTIFYNLVNIHKPFTVYLKIKLNIKILHYKHIIKWVFHIILSTSHQIIIIV